MSSVQLIVILLAAILTVSCGESNIPTTVESSSSSSSSSGSQSSSADTTVFVSQGDKSVMCYFSGISESDHDGYTNNGYLNADNKAGVAASWVIQADEETTVDLSVRFAHGAESARPANVLLNAQQVIANFDFPQSAWDDWLQETVQITLSKGTHTLELVSETNGGLPNIDEIQISGASVALGDCALSQALPNISVWIAGDSTVQTYNNTASPNDQAGWGQMLHEQFNDKVTVNNHAIGGRTARRFIDEGRLDTVWSQVQAGDVFLIQFGTNDGHRSATYTINGDVIPYYLDPNTDFKEYLQRYIDGAMARDVLPVLVSPPPRNSAYCTGGNGTGSHAQAMRELATQNNVLLVDLNQSVVNYLMAICPSPTPEDFFFLRANGSVDGTHFQENGARIMSRMVAEGIKNSNITLGRYHP